MFIRIYIFLLFLFFSIININSVYGENPGFVVLQSDYGTVSGEVGRAKGKIYSINPSLRIEDLSHEVSQFNVNDAAYALYSGSMEWPKGTVFVSMVNPGGYRYNNMVSARSQREASIIVLKSKRGHYFIAPNNGTLTIIDEMYGSEAIRLVSHSNSRNNVDVHLQTAAMLASNKLKFENIGVPISHINTFFYKRPNFSGSLLHGIVAMHDVRFGNIMTNVNYSLWRHFNMKLGNNYHVKIFDENRKKVYDTTVPFVNTFDDVDVNSELLYINGLGNLSLAINHGNFAAKHGIESGSSHTIEISK